MRVRTNSVGAQFLVILVAAIVLAGCSDIGTTKSTTPARTVPNAHVVLAVIDGGILPYHSEFRDTTDEAFEPPSSYISGYPTDALALNLTIGSGNVEDALKHDAAAWANVKPGKLYWIPGTRIIGLIVIDKNITEPWSDQHGTMTASRAAGTNAGLGSAAKLVLVLGLGAKSVEWAAQQPWIDLQSNSWGEQIPDPGGRAFPTAQADHDALADAAKSQITVVSAGNGEPSHALTGGGIIGTPSMLEATAPAGAIVVGAEDNGFVTPWANTQPDVVADGCRAIAADLSNQANVAPNADGTSAAAPYVAGEIAQIILSARQFLGDASVHHDHGILAVGTPPGPQGPLADGKLTADELKSLVFDTATLSPEPDSHDGERCPDAPTSPGNPYTADVPISALQPPQSFYEVGYGVVSVQTLSKAVSVMKGTLSAPDRALEDQLYTAQSSLRH